MNRKIIYLVIVALAAFAIWKIYAPAVEESGEALVAVKVPELSQAALDGKFAYDEKCGTCHGRNAAGVNGSGPPLIHIIYEPSHHGDQAFLLAAKTGVRSHHWKFGNMPPVEGISDEAVAKIIYYVREVQRANGIQ